MGPPTEEPYLLHHDQHGRQKVFSLPDSWTGATIGRGAYADLVLSWDPRVSTVHAELERLGDSWFLADDGISRNGSFVNGERVSGRRRLRDGDVLRLGQTTLTFHAPLEAGSQTLIGVELPENLGRREEA